MFFVEVTRYIKILTLSRFEKYNIFAPYFHHPVILNSQVTKTLQIQLIQMRQVIRLECMDN